MNARSSQDFAIMAAAKIRWVAIRVAATRATHSMKMELNAWVS